MKEPFSDRPDAEHPVRWNSADGNETAWITRKGAVERLEGYGMDPAFVREHFSALGRGPLRTPFAFYELDPIAFSEIA